MRRSDGRTFDGQKDLSTHKLVFLDPNGGRPRYGELLVHVIEAPKTLDVGGRAPFVIRCDMLNPDRVAGVEEEGFSGRSEPEGGP